MNDISTEIHVWRQNLTLEQKEAVVVGANGIIGGTLIAHLEALGDCEIVGLSRRGGTTQGKMSHIAVDLLDATDTKDKLAHLSDVTHIFYAAYQERPGWAELVAPNLA